MKFKNKLFIKISILTVLFCSCKKQESISNSNNLIKTKTTSTSTEHYFYDAKNRISRIDFYTNHSDTVSYYYTYIYTDSASYEYHSNEAISTNYDSIFINCDKNPHKLNLQYNRYFMHLNEDCFSWSEGYTYFPDGFKQTSYIYDIDGGGIDTYYNDGVNYIYSKGNFAGMTGFGDDQHTYYYYADKLNTIGNSNFGKQFLGKSSYCLIYQETIQTRNMRDTMIFTDTISYNYEWDNANRVILSYKHIGHYLLEDTARYTYY